MIILRIRHIFARKNKRLTSFFEMKQRYYQLIAIAVVFIWGTTFISTKILINYGLSPQDVFFYRFLLAYIGIWTISPLKLFADNWKDELYMMVGGITGGSLFFFLQNLSLQMTQASNVSFIICTSPLSATILTVLCTRNEKFTKRFVYGSLAALLGVGLVIFNGNVVLKLSPTGDFLALSASLLWGVYSLIIKRITNNYSSIFITRKVFFYGILTILPVFLIQPLFMDFDLLVTPVILGNLLFLGIAASLGCYLLWNIVVSKMGVIQSSNYLYLNPLATMLGAYAVLNEQITLVALGGMILILTGIYIATRKQEP